MQTVSPPNAADRRAASLVALGHGFAEDLLRGMLSAVLPNDALPGETPDCRIGSAIAAFDSLRPRNHMEAMLAAQVIVCHYASMDLFRRANLPGVSDEASMRLRKSAMSTMRAMTAATRALERSQAKPVPAPQPGVAPPDVAPENAMPDAEAPAVARAIAGAIEGMRPRPNAPMDEAPMDEALLHDIRMGEAFMREHIARAHAAIDKRHGFDRYPDSGPADPSLPDPSLDDPFSAEAMLAALQSHRQPL